MIKIDRVGDRYDVSVSPPSGPDWRSTEPLTTTELLEQLSALGCRPTDITDAFDATLTDGAVRPPRLLPGRSSLEEALRNPPLNNAGIVFILAVVLASAVLDGAARYVADIALGIAGLTAVLLASRARWASLQMDRRESEAGYTTRCGSHQELWQLEPRTGAVLRRPGEPLISLDEARRRGRAAAGQRR